MLNEIKVNDTILPDEEMVAIREISQRLMKLSKNGSLNVAMSVLGAMMFTRVLCGCPNCSDSINTEIIASNLDEVKAKILELVPNTLKSKREFWLLDNLNNHTIKH